MNQVAMMEKGIKNARYWGKDTKNKNNNNTQQNQSKKERKNQDIYQDAYERNSDRKRFTCVYTVLTIRLRINAISTHIRNLLL